MPKVITLSGLRQMGVENPASVNCIALGGKLEVVNKPSGQVGFCTLPDGTVCEEWALYRKECAAATPAISCTTTIVLDGVEYCRTADGKLYNKQTGEEYYDPSAAPKLLNYGIAAGFGAAVGLLAVVLMPKAKGRSKHALLGSLVGAGVGTALLAATWPKSKLPEIA